MMNGTKLFTDSGDPIYQPLLKSGFRWNETTGPGKPGFWTDSDSTITTTDAVVTATGINAAELEAWQRARDDEVEAEMRGDWEW